VSIEKCSNQFRRKKVGFLREIYISNIDNSSSDEPFLLEECPFCSKFFAVSELQKHVDAQHPDFGAAEAISSFPPRLVCPWNEI
jgi:hypothetical protein